MKVESCLRGNFPRFFFSFSSSLSPPFSRLHSLCLSLRGKPSTFLLMCLTRLNLIIFGESLTFSLFFFFLLSFFSFLTFLNLIVYTSRTVERVVGLSFPILNVYYRFERSEKCILEGISARTVSKRYVKIIIYLRNYMYAYESFILEAN